MGCQLFHSGLTLNQSRDIENVQKRTLKIILGKVYTNYEEACTLLSCEPLSDRRDTLCLTFVIRAVKNGWHIYNSPLVYLCTSQEFTTRA